MNQYKRNRRGGSSILAVFFVTLFSVLSIAFTAMSSVNVKMATNYRDVVATQSAAESGLEYALYLVRSYVPPAEANTMVNTVSETEARESFGYFATHVQSLLAGSDILEGQGIAWDSGSYVLQVPSSGGIRLSDTTSNTRFAIRFDFVAGDTDHPNQLMVTSTGYTGLTSRSVRMYFPIQKQNKTLEYAIATRGRMWITGDSTIHGDIFSSWDRPEISPFNMTSDSRVEGKINTILSRSDMLAAGVQMETLNEDGLPVDADGNPITDNYEDRYYAPEDEIQGYHRGINYDTPYQNMPGMSIEDYNTTAYKIGLTSLSTSSTKATEYFPHAVGNYSLPSPSGGLKLTRNVYQNQTYTNIKISSNNNAVFKNCTFNGILYVDCSATSTSYTNNIRFDNCNFNGAIVTNAPQPFDWRKNCLYFTGSATFNNAALAEATILAPHFNVNLGNTTPIAGNTNQLTGAIIGGIVDIRGNADIYGTIISMFDTTPYSSGYVTNIGATLGDGGSETVELGDIGTINIVPDKSKMLPSGIKTPIVIN